MPKKRRRKRTYSRKTHSSPKESLFSNMSPETKKGILVFCLLILGFLSFLALFDLSGSLGRGMLKLMSWSVGWFYFILPLLFIILGYIFLNPKKYIIEFRHCIGMLLFLFSSTGFLNLILRTDEIMPFLKEGQGGGSIGMLFYWPLFNLAGFWGAIVILIGLFVISVLLIFDLSISDLNLVEKFKGLFRLRREKIDDDDEFEYEEEKVKSRRKEKTRSIFSKKQSAQKNTVEPTTETYQKPLADQKKDETMPISKKVYRDIKIPLNLLNDKKSQPISMDIESGKEKIQKTLENFNIHVEMKEVNVGPTVTQFTLKPDETVRLTKIITLQDNLSLSLAAHPLRIEAPIPGRSLVGIEVPNKVASLVRLKEILSDPVFQKSEGSLSFALGKNVSGKNIVVDLAKMPHLLIAGSTGSGKSVCINALILSLLYRSNPNELKFIMVDPKRVELSPFNGIPHLLTPVITKVDKTINALKWAVNEMDKRYDILSKANKKDIYGYNDSVSLEHKMASIVIVIDELADLMAVAAQDVEGAIIRLAQMARAIGIHLVLATQRPSVNVITGLIKANITSRIAFSVASQIDSRTMIDTGGAEKLLGRGDMLFVSADLSKPRRLQGAFVSEQEKENIIEFLRKQAEPDYLDEVTESESATSSFISKGRNGDYDKLLMEAKEVVIRQEKASATLLQRRLRVGYARAARILDELEEIGVVGPANGPKPRDVLMQESGGQSQLNSIPESPVIETNQDGINEELEEAADEILESNEDDDNQTRSNENVVEEDEFEIEEDFFEEEGRD
ncbi:DNA translocase FtsK [bacterium]|nr:DNA translocase FtsK [bacterium]